MIQTLDRSIYEKTGAKKYRQKCRTKRRYTLKKVQVKLP